MFQGIFIIPVYAEPIQIKVIQSWPGPVKWNLLVTDYCTRVEKKLPGQLKFKLIGGPEAIPTYQQGEAVRTGVVDMLIGGSVYYSGEMPVIDAMKLITMPQWEAREKGVYKYINDLHEKVLNAHYIGNQLPYNVKFHLYTTKPITKMEDFKGMVIRVTPVYRAFVKALGASPVSVAPPEVYTSLERGMVEGLGWPTLYMTDLGWQAAIKYRIDPGFYTMTGTVIMNLDKWKSLRPQIREVMNSTMLDFEKEMAQRFIPILEKEKEILSKAGVKIITLDPAEAEKYVFMAYESGWQEILEERAREEGAKLKALLEN